jgi:hypothetical protein
MEPSARITKTDVILGAVDAAARVLEGNAEEAVKRPEARLRHALVDELATFPEVEAALPEWRPKLPLWPGSLKTRLGGFDLALRFVGDEDYSVVCELKWSSGKGLDALDEVPWDCFKLAHAVGTLDNVGTGLLIYAAPSTGWERARFRDLFSELSLGSTRRLIDENKNVWRWLLKGSSESRPTRLPPFVRTSLVGKTPLSYLGTSWEIRVAAVSPEGEPWYELDEDGWPLPEDRPVIFDWPVPEPGPGMVAASVEDEFRLPSEGPSEKENAELDADDLPGPQATWDEISWFALRFNGYERYGSESLGELANETADHFREQGRLLTGRTLTELRACLFFEQHRHYHFGHAPGAEATAYIRALIEGIRTCVRARDLR